VLFRSVFTEPSKRVELHFPEMGIVRKLHVKEGDFIKAGQLLMELDDDIEQAELKRLNEEAESNARIEYYEEDLTYKQLDLGRKLQANKNARTGSIAYTDSEIDLAKTDAAKAAKQIDVEKQNHRSDQIKRDQQQIKVNKMKLYAGFDGRVEKIMSWEGELGSVDKDKPAIILVQNDPCNVVINTLDSEQVAKLKKDDVIQVRYPGEQQWREAKVVFIAPVAAQDVHTQQVKLELPNPENRDTGKQIQVMLPAKIVGASPRNPASNR